ncbi:addiction module toxin RelE [Clostridia bacterium]|nr:addiction module toxin RelE [Clostridia bacterium]
MKLLYSPPASKYLKKIKDKRLRKEFFETIDKILANPTIGKPKKGDLKGRLCYGFYYDRTEYRVSYRVINNETLLIVTVGTHENFYRDLKRYLK